MGRQKSRHPSVKNAFHERKCGGGSGTSCAPVWKTARAARGACRGCATPTPSHRTRAWIIQPAAELVHKHTRVVSRRICSAEYSAVICEARVSGEASTGPRRQHMPWIVSTTYTAYWVAEGQAVRAGCECADVEGELCRHRGPYTENS